MDWERRTATFRKHGYTTNSMLLTRLAAAEEDAWVEFEKKYRTMICAAGQKRGLSEEDCEDLMQDVMLVCCQRLASFSYDRRKGRFRSYLTAIVNNLSWQLLRRKRPVEALPPEYDEGIDLVFMKEYEDFLLEKLLALLKERVSSETYSVFEMLCLQQMPVQEVSRITRKTPGCIYLIRHRCMNILKACIAGIPEAAERIHGKGNSSRKPSAFCKE